MADSRPVYLNLFKIRLPVTGIVSLAHRVTGVLMFLSLPVLAWMLERSVSGEAGFAQVTGLFDELPARLLALVLTWSLLHHFFAGIRFMFIDLDIGVVKAQSRLSAWLVIAAEVTTLLILGWAWL